MAVEIHYVNVGLFHVSSEGGPVLLKNDPDVTLKQMAVSSQEHRVIPRTTGPCSTTNSAGYPTIPQYLALEAGDDFALAYMDQFTIITQMIT
jgi:hypothetical protein